jgi:cytochrome P450
MRISRRTHAFVDIATIGFALAFPRLLGASSRFTSTITAVALGKLAYTLLTRQETGLLKVVPMKVHLGLDAAGGAALCALPFISRKRENSAVTACAVGLGIFDIAAAATTERRSRPEMDESVIFTPGAGAPAERIPATKRLPTATVLDTLKIISRVLIPTIAMGPIIRRPGVMARAERNDLGTIAVKTLQEMRARYGPGPLMLKLPFRSQAVLLDPDHVRRVLDESPEPFATASTEKQAALAHFEPRGALISHGAARAERRRLNEEVLEAKDATHHMAQAFLPIVDEEAGALLERVGRSGGLGWDEFFDAWFAMVRRVVFGNSARNDRRITDIMVRLRSDGNWGFLKPRKTHLRDELHGGIRRYIDKAEPGSLSAYIAALRPSAIQSPENQVPQWLFAFDPAAMATFRALALLAAHPDQMERARGETGLAAGKPHRPFLRACVLEALRLWPTTPMILRQTTRQTEWETGTMPPRTGILIYAPYFHRDDQNLRDAHRFNPDLWINDDPQVKGHPPRVWPFVPFSGGSAHCPGQNLVLLLTSGMLAAIIGDRTLRLEDPHRMPPGRLPGSQDHFTLRFQIAGAGVGLSRPTAGAVAGA